jgi:transcriptional regulator GlxA family with amidase domain
MRRREFLVTGSTAAALMLTPQINAFNLVETNKLTPPADGPIRVAFAMSRGATMIDFAGPWEVFQDVMIHDPKNQSEHRHPFSLYTVSDKLDPIEASGGMKIVPDYTFETAPAPKVVVIPAQAGSPALHAWLRKIVDSTDVTMSVCTGAFQLGKAGLLTGKEATTHHDFFDQFAKAFPDVKLKRGLRFVEGSRISTAGGLTSGIDLALRVVERYFGREAAEQTAFYMEYQSKGWIV